MNETRQFTKIVVQRLLALAILAGLMTLVAMLVPGWVSTGSVVATVTAGLVTLSLITAAEWRRQQLARLRAERVRSRRP